MSLGTATSLTGGCSSGKVFRRPSSFFVQVSDHISDNRCIEAMRRRTEGEEETREVVGMPCSEWLVGRPEAGPLSPLPLSNALETLLSHSVAFDRCDGDKGS